MGDPSGKNPSSGSAQPVGREKELTPDEAEAFARQFKAVWEKSAKSAGASTTASEHGVAAPGAAAEQKRPDSYPAGPLSPRPQDITPRGIGPVSILPVASAAPMAPALAAVPVTPPPPPPDIPSAVPLVPKPGLSTRPAPKQTLLGMAPVVLPPVIPIGDDTAVAPTSAVTPPATSTLAESPKNSGIPATPVAPSSSAPAPAPAPGAQSAPPPPVQVGVQVLQEKPVSASPAPNLPSVILEPNARTGAPGFPVPASPPVRPAASTFEVGDTPNLRPRSNGTLIAIGVGVVLLVLVAFLTFGGKSERKEDAASSSTNRSESLTAPAPTRTPAPEEASTEKQPAQAAPTVAAAPKEPAPEAVEAPAAAEAAVHPTPSAAKKPTSKPPKQASSARAKPAPAKRPAEPKSPPAKAPASPPKSPAIVRDNPF